MFKIGDKVFITNEKCINHEGRLTCCECDLTRSVEVIEVGSHEFTFPIRVLLPNGTSCLFALCHVKKVKPKEG